MFDINLDGIGVGYVGCIDFNDLFGVVFIDDVVVLVVWKYIGLIVDIFYIFLDVIN